MSAFDDIKRAAEEIKRLAQNIDTMAPRQKVSPDNIRRIEDAADRILRINRELEDQRVAQAVRDKERA